VKLKIALDAEKCGVDHERARPVRKKPAQLAAFRGAIGASSGASFMVITAATGARRAAATTGTVAPLAAPVKAAKRAGTGGLAVLCARGRGFSPGPGALKETQGRPKFP